MFTSLLVGITLITPDAAAGKCDSYLRQANSTSGSSLIRAFERLASCDSTMAEQNFHQIMTRATDAESLTNLSIAAINGNIWSPVWTMLGKISSYEARDAVAESIGQECSSNDKVVTFLQGAYAGLKDIDFQQWDDAFLSCDSASLSDWMIQQIENPPEKMFDGKFEKLVDILVAQKGRDALPYLITGAINAADNGPYNKMLEAMNIAVTPTLGTGIPPEDQRALEQALIQVAQGVSPNKAREVADSLAGSGSEQAAISLLPTIYSDRLQNGGGFLYGVASIETGECKGEKTAIIHYAQVEEPGSRWLIDDEVEGPIRAVKPRLKKCTPEDGEWIVRITLEPLSSGSAIGGWVDDLEGQWTGQGYEVSTRSEKAIILD